VALGSEPVLARVVRRLQCATKITEVVIATTKMPEDNSIVEFCAGHGVACFRGAEHDVLDRFLRAGEQFGCDAIVRVTADCPLIDPELADEVIEAFMEQKADFACNEVPRTFPRGLDVEVFTLQALQKANSVAKQPYQREHVTPIFYERPDLFRVVSIGGQRDFSHYRWTLDTEQDLLLIRAIYRHFDNRDDFSWTEAVAMMEQFPELANINADIVQKPVREVDKMFAH
jgi:spore coat polysaccharide biosynthesis protein SpsF